MVYTLLGEQPADAAQQSLQSTDGGRACCKVIERGPITHENILLGKVEYIRMHTHIHAN